jgi:hypothetical protein
MGSTVIQLDNEKLVLSEKIVKLHPSEVEQIIGSLKEDNPKQLFAVALNDKVINWYYPHDAKIIDTLGVLEFLKISIANAKDL